MIVFITIWILFARPLLAAQAIAHRGLYHDVTDECVLAENSNDALYRAYDLGLPGVELDLRLDSSGEVLIAHDAISNRATVKDNYGGILNPIDVWWKLQPSKPGIYFAGHSTKYWNLTQLKAYGRNGRIVNQTDGVQKLETLDAMLGHFKDLIIDAPKFWLFLDIQDSTILRLAGALVQKYGLGGSVFLKFFATKAIDSTNSPYNGADTCYRYARDNNLNVFQTTLSVNSYLQCWADAQKAHSGNGAALMPMVSASVPSKNRLNYQLAYQAAMNWAGGNGRLKVSIITQPDAGRLSNGKCTFWVFQSNSVVAAPFDEVAQSSKTAFATGPADADFIIVDIMGDLQNLGHRW